MKYSLLALVCVLLACVAVSLAWRTEVAHPTDPSRDGIYPLVEIEDRGHKQLISGHLR